MKTKYMSEHQQRVMRFMNGAIQPGKGGVPSSPTIPDYPTRELCARLILEEALETIAALGVDVQQRALYQGEPLTIENVYFCMGSAPNLVEIADGCGDISVVVQFTLLKCGIPDKPILEAIDANNLLKVVNPSWDENGKIRKPANHPRVDLAKVLESL